MLIGCAPAEPQVVASSFERLEQKGLCGEGTPRACDTTGWTLCSVEPSSADANGDGVLDCTQDMVPSDVGWCYVDPEKGLGDERLVQSCEPDERRILRFVDPQEQTPATGATVLIACSGAPLDDPPAGP